MNNENITPGTGTTASAAGTIELPKPAGTYEYVVKDCQWSHVAPAFSEAQMQAYGAALAEEARREGADYKNLWENSRISCNQLRDAIKELRYGAVEDARVIAELREQIAQRTAGGDAVKIMAETIQALTVEIAQLREEVERLTVANEIATALAHPVAEAAAQEDDVAQVQTDAWGVQHVPTGKWITEHGTDRIALVSEQNALNMCINAEYLARPLRITIATTAAAPTAQPTPIKNPADAESAEGGTVWEGIVAQPTPPDDERAMGG